ncbi:MAG: hypothetical protein A2W90_22645 [Bacteroidetes bacterium GWF2_42_66]|nr:MAG: hypothetical protein A2W92_22050 [Bacteroidetes bacterium GWA2_42_15]OFY03129.1 MAG: hypothetical protein A2W89_13425 [Bacteroidetes bacterium GWE2_42_39]OFY45237.1 MAG: hypothetical protein A2W90_22645 [Bacteroidetes bacterium GWF2_42_66]HAZ02133.1 hypothetical protein [Marinilabiliales bacterium]HBL74104.1 hypothetical protein [Prolixibacteraceae bacterium]
MKFFNKLTIPYLSYLMLIFVFLTVSGNAETLKHSEFKYKIAIIGNPCNPDIRYDSKQLSELKKLGYNTIQLNIAWGSRPADEALNLEDILYSGIGKRETVEKRLKDIKFRAKEAKKYGFRTIFHFGAPRIDSMYKKLSKPTTIDWETETNSIQKNEIVQKYIDLLKRLKQEIPEIDDILVYTFDQEAWIANEFGNGPTDRDIPLHERLPAFLNALTETWAKLSPNGLLWWEPWELSAGQIYSCIPALPDHHFGLCIHSNIAEVQLTRPVDVWFKNMVNILSDKNIPVIGEIFMGSSTEELQPLQHLAAPRLVFEEFEAMYGLYNLAGIKEYYGVLPDTYDPNLIVAGMKMKNPSMTWQQALGQLSKTFGKAGSQISAAWEASAKGLQLFPWDCTWNFRRLPLRRHVFHGFKKAGIPGKVATSPSWKSTRRSIFMITENEVLDPWFFEDIELRCKASADQILVAINAYEQVQNVLPYKHEHQLYISSVIADLKVFEQTVRGIQCYCREVNLTFLMRKHVSNGKPIPTDLINRFNTIMKIDIENQQKGVEKSGRNVTSAAEMLKEFNTDPKKWVIENFLETK